MNLQETRKSTNFNQNENCGGLEFLDIFDFEYYQERHARDATNWYNENKHLIDDPT